MHLEIKSLLLQRVLHISKYQKRDKCKNHKSAINDFKFCIYSIPILFRK